MAEQNKNQIVVLEPVTKTVNELLEMITDRDQAEIMPFMNPEEAIQCTRQFVPCMLVICIQSNNDLPNVLGVLKKLKPDIKQGLVKTLLVSKVKNPQLQKLVGEFGVTDYIEEPIPARSLQFKANLQLKAIDTTRKQLELKKAADEKIVFKTSARPGEEDAQATNGDIKPRQKPALALANDTFLIKNGSVKKQAKKFVVELDGPDPSTGEWVADGDNQNNPNWRWKPHDPEDEPGSEDGDGWVAAGEKPQFKPANKKWQLSSEKPGLFFKKKNLKVAEKISTDMAGEVSVADDSEAAEENLRKNLVKSERIKKRKLAEKAHAEAKEEEEKPETEAKAVSPEAAEEETSGSAAILKALRKKKAAKEAKAANGQEASNEESAKAETPEEEKSDARKKLEAMRLAKRQRKAERAVAGLPEEEETVEEKAIEAKAEAEVEEEENSPTAIARRQRKKKTKEKAEGDVLDFLQKKKDAKTKTDGEADDGSSDDESAVNATADSTEEEGDSPAALKKRKRGKKAKKGEVGEGEGEESAEVESDSPILEAPEAEEESDEPRVTKSEEGTPEEEEKADDILARARERRRKREERKKTLLEEIQGEEEEQAEEIETLERKKKERPEADAAEIEEEEKAARNERLEKLRRKRDELAALERQQDEEEQGEHLHTAQAEELRGMNVWDTDEDAPEDEGPAEKLLKRLKKDRKEQAEKEKAEKDKLDAEEEFASDDPLEAKKKKKKKSTGPQAEGLEDAFADEEEESAENSAAASDSLEKNSTEGEAPAEESLSDRLSRLRKKRDEKKDLLEGTDETSSEDLRAEKSESEAEDEQEDLLASDKAEKKSKDHTSSAEEESGSLEAIAGKEEKEDGRSADEESSSSQEEKSEVANLDLESPKKEEPSSPLLKADEKLAKKSETSESMKRFLERRKKRKEEAKFDDFSAKKQENQDADAAAANREAPQKRSFLSIFVALSDSFGGASEKKLLNILRAFENALESCAAAITGAKQENGAVKVLLASSFEKGADIPSSGNRVYDFLRSDGQLVGHFLIGPISPRTEFAADELETIERAMLTLSPLVTTWLEGPGAQPKEQKAA